jgi:hypothetical protein
MGHVIWVFFPTGERRELERNLVQAYPGHPCTGAAQTPSGWVYSTTDPGWERAGNLSDQISQSLPPQNPILHPRICAVSTQYCSVT